MHKAYKYRLYPNKEQALKLQWTLDRCRELYNAALQERKEAYKYTGKSINYYDQCKDLPAIKDLCPEYKDIYAQALQDVLRRVDKTFKAFFARCKRGATPGYPRYKGRGRYDSFTYPQKGFSLTHDHRVCLSKVGDVKIKLHRPMEVPIKTCTVKREGQHWYAVFTCEIEAQQVYHPSEEQVGVDLGLLHFATLSTGETIENPRHYRRAEKRLKCLQQELSRKKRGSHRRKKAVQRVAKAHRKIRNQRRDFLHKASHTLVTRYQTVVFEELQPTNMNRRPKAKQDEETGQYLPNGASAKAGLNKSINDAGWSEFVTMCEHKAASAGARVVQVNPKYTSQMCSGCGRVKKKDLSDRWHSCGCGTELDRDHNAALNILRLGRSLQSALTVKAPCP